MAKVTFSYEPENEDELKIEVGEIVEILKQVSKIQHNINVKGTYMCRKFGVFYDYLPGLDRWLMKVNMLSVQNMLP